MIAFTHKQWALLGPAIVAFVETMPQVSGRSATDETKGDDMREAIAVLAAAHLQASADFCHRDPEAEMMALGSRSLDLYLQTQALEAAGKPRQ